MNYWIADVKFGGGAGTVAYIDGEWTATGEGSDILLSQFRAKLDAAIDAYDGNIMVDGTRPLMFASALRSVTPVYGITTNLDEGDEDEVN